MFLTKYSNSMMTQFKKNQNDRKLSLKEIGKLSLVVVWQIIPENYLVWENLCFLHGILNYLVCFKIVLNRLKSSTNARVKSFV